MHAILLFEGACLGFFRVQTLRSFVHVFLQSIFFSLPHLTYFSLPMWIFLQQNFNPCLNHDRQIIRVRVLKRLLCFADKVLLEHSHACLSTICSLFTIELSKNTQEFMACKARNICPKKVFRPWARPTVLKAWSRDLWISLIFFWGFWEVLLSQ